MYFETKCARVIYSPRLRYKSKAQLFIIIIIIIIICKIYSAPITLYKAMGALHSSQVKVS